MSRAPTKGKRRHDVSLRTILLLTAIGLTVYSGVSIIAVARLMPAVKELGVAANLIAEAARPIHQMDSVIGAAVQDLWFDMESTLRTGSRADRNIARGILIRIGRYADSRQSAQALPVFGPLDPMARLALSRALTAQSRAVGKLTDAASAYELGWTDRAAAALRDAEQARGAATRHVHEAELYCFARQANRQAALIASANELLRSVVLWGVGGVVLLVLTGIVIYQRLYRPLQSIDGVLDRVAEGDLDVQLPVERRDELGRLQERFNAMLLALHERSAEEQKRTHNLSERLGRTLDASSNEIYIFGVEDWRFLYANRGAQENLGYTEEQLAERTPLDILPELDQTRFALVLNRLQDGSETRTLLSTVHRRSDGTEYPVELSVQLSNAEDPPVFHVIAQDMTERARIESDRDRMFRLSPDLLAAGTFEEHLTRVNAAWGRRLGFTEEELLSKPFMSLVHPEDATLARAQLVGLRNGRPVQGAAIRMRCRDGSYRWISWNVDPPSADGVLNAVGRDITEHRQAQERQARLLATIARSAREWKVTFDALDDPILVVNRKGQVTRANDAARRLAGIPHPELIQVPVEDLPPQQLWRPTATVMGRAFATGKSASHQVEWTDNHQVWDVEVNPLLDSNPERSAAIVIAHDVTRVIELQDSVRRNEAMAATGALVAGVAHEVRNPLFSMTATLDAFEARQGKDHAGQQSMQVLRSQLDRLRQLMQDLLDYGKPPKLNLATVSFEHVARQVLEETAQVAAECHIAVVTNIEGELPPIQADHDRLVQVYVNLVSNAVQHSPEQGKVVLRAREICEDGTSWLEASVEDCGKGFEPDHLPHVFEPFFTRRRGGTGLGLALVQRIVEQHGGTVYASNRNEGGGVVFVRIPIPDPRHTGRSATVPGA
ncbi:MAG: PAS domain S-box protein [Gemmatimonadota bacterium]|nr:MAG: PAS domain S-box protein [Gemmatimonadota bacterium]